MLPFPMHSALAFTSFTSFTSFAATASYTIAPSRIFAFRQNFRACHLRFRRPAAPLFSYSLAPIREGYELLFPPARRTLSGQTLCFDNLPHCPGGWGSNESCSRFSLCALCLGGKSILFILLRTLCRREKTHLPWNQQLPHSFSETPGGGVRQHPSTPSRNVDAAHTSNH